MYFFVFNLEILHLTEFFSRASPLVPVTNMSLWFFGHVGCRWHLLVIWYDFEVLACCNACRRQIIGEKKPLSAAI